MKVPPHLMFCVLSHNEPIPNASCPFFILTKDNWNDFGYEVQFYLYIKREDSKQRIGKVKILHRNITKTDSFSVKTKTTLDPTFDKLDDNFISLGQADSYYQNLHKHCEDKAGDVLIALRDIAWQPGLATDFEPTSGFRNAMMRENGAHRSRRFGRAWAMGDQSSEQFSFSYFGTINSAESPINTKIEFNEKDLLPGRIVAIIGRNAVGKTRFLAKLSEDLAQISRTSAERLNETQERFSGERPLFTRIIAISYSAFDYFKRPTPDASSSYVYCGIRNETGGLSSSSLSEAYRKHQERIRDLERKSKWTDYMSVILGDSVRDLRIRLEEEISEPSNGGETLFTLSSGQSILCHFVTALLAWIQPNSLVLFDEPETHLHPNAVALLFRILSIILKEFDSYAIVATHSPLVIQEVPAKRVLVFKRSGNVTIAEPLLIESFGESISELTRHVFETIEVESLYRATLKKLAKTEPVKEVMEKFDLGLSLSAQAYLLAQYDKKKSNNQ